MRFATALFLTCLISLPIKARELTQDEFVTLTVISIIPNKTKKKIVETYKEYLVYETETVEVRPLERTVRVGDNWEVEVKDDRTMIRYRYRF